MKERTRKGTQMINSDLIQTLVIDRPNLRMNNRKKIVGGDLLWRPTETPKNPIFERFSNIFTQTWLMDKSCSNQ